MIPWAKMASDLDSNPKIAKAGFLGTAVYLFLLRRNALMGADGTLPADILNPEYIAEQLRCTVEQAATGCNACNVAGLISVADRCVHISGWEEWASGGGKKALSSTERSRKRRESIQHATMQRDATLHATANATATAEKRREEERREEETREEKEEREPSPAARGSGVSQAPVLSLVAQEPAPRAPRKAPSLPLPADWAPSPAHVALAHQLAVSVTAEADKMRDWAEAKGERKVNWDAAFSGWLRRAGEARAGPGRGGGGRPPWQPNTAGSDLPRLLEDIERMERES